MHWNLMIHSDKTWKIYADFLSFYGLLSVADQKCKTTFLQTICPHWNARKIICLTIVQFIDIRFYFSLRYLLRNHWPWSWAPRALQNKLTKAQQYHRTITITSTVLVRVIGSNQISVIEPTINQTMTWRYLRQSNHAACCYVPNGRTVWAPCPLTTAAIHAARRLGSSSHNQHCFHRHQHHGRIKTPLRLRACSVQMQQPFPYMISLAGVRWP